MDGKGRDRERRRGPSSNPGPGSEGEPGGGNGPEADPEEAADPEKRREEAARRIRGVRGGGEGGEEYANASYRGSSIYVKSDGATYKKIGVEVRLDQYEALCAARAAAGVKRPDPWGRNASEIVRSLLDEAGFDASYGGA